eukprot:CAMPEP_0170318384 /NCGR_PEP_ID=MMETSP0116_2-20130129/59888_1 /TAXON_ID=400756 /ORGANISM="Durinskia baltica, Strain CSIRO CS-38" /LENGTH=65 /DNA_ID=CAMNT_0010571079 /DNA_START=51 /DNA_END=245 /DNA_ORIENTATION=-
MDNLALGNVSPPQGGRRGTTAAPAWQTHCRPSGATCAAQTPLRLLTTMGRRHGAMPTKGRATPAA